MLAVTDGCFFLFFSVSVELRSNVKGIYSGLVLSVFYLSMRIQQVHIWLNVPKNALVVT